MENIENIRAEEKLLFKWANILHQELASENPDILNVFDYLSMLTDRAIKVALQISSEEYDKNLEE